MVEAIAKVQHVLAKKASSDENIEESLNTITRERTKGESDLKEQAFDQFKVELQNEDKEDQKDAEVESSDDDFFLKQQEMFGFSQSQVTPVTEALEEE